MKDDYEAAKMNIPAPGGVEAINAEDALKREVKDKGSSKHGEIDTSHRRHTGSASGTSRQDREAKRKTRRHSPHRDATPGAYSSNAESDLNRRAKEAGTKSVSGKSRQDREAKRKARRHSPHRDATPGAYSSNAESDLSRRAKEAGTKRRAKPRNPRFMPRKYSRQDRKKQKEVDAKRKGRRTTPSAGPGVEAYPAEFSGDPVATAGASNAVVGSPEEVHAITIDDEEEEDVEASEREPNVNLVPQTAERNDRDKAQEEPREKTGFCTRKRCLLFVTLLVVAVAVVAFLATRGSNEAASGTAPDTGTSGPTATTSTPTSLPSSNPTSAPTEEIVYERPSDEDCLKIKSNIALDGQSNLAVQTFDLHFDVNLTVETDDFDGVTDDFSTAVEKYLVPDLAGCEDTGRLLGDSSMRGLRKLANIRYIIANAESLVEYDDSESRFNVYLRLFPKGPVSIPVMTSHLISIISPEVAERTLVERYNLPPAAFNSVVLAGVVYRNPTLAPTSVPTPADWPTTEYPTKQPSSDPSAFPSMTPSYSPSIEPSHLPSAVPSISPSSHPSVEPSESPSGVPSSPPTNQPSLLLTSSPSHFPTWAPSPNPTPLPTHVPTISHVPTNAPTTPVFISNDRRFKASTTTITQTDDFEATCRSDFGDDFTVADYYYDIKTFLEESDASNLVTALSMPKGSTSYPYFVNYKGSKFSSDQSDFYVIGTRVFFVENHGDDAPNSNWFDKYGKLELGAWYGLSGQALCVSTLVATGGR